MFGPLVPCWMVRLWGSEELFVKSMLTEPALALRVALVNFSCPPGSAASVIVPPAPPPAEAELDGAAELVEALEEAGALELVALLLLLLLLEPPQAASAKAVMEAIRTAGVLYM